MNQRLFLFLAFVGYTSAVALTKPNITSIPMTNNYTKIASGATIIFTCDIASGEIADSFVWDVNSVTVAGETGKMYDRIFTFADDGISVKCQAKNATSGDSPFSDPLMVHVANGSAITPTTQATNTTLVLGATAMTTSWLLIVSAFIIILGLEMLQRK